MTAASRGWGPGWPDCQRDKIVGLTVAGVSFPGGVRREVAPIFRSFVTQFHQQVEPLRDGWCWGFACRAIRGTSRPSNHSWGLAVDLNAPRHPMGSVGTFSSSQAATIRRLCKEHGMRWGGDYSGRKDEMHVEYMGTKADALAWVARNIGETGDAEMLNTNSPDGEAVERHQRALLAWNPQALPQYGADGDYGGETEEWVGKYQTAVGLPATGIIGGVTSAMLLSELDAPAPTTVPAHHHNDLYVTKGVYGAHRHDEGRTGGPQ